MADNQYLERLNITRHEWRKLDYKEKLELFDYIRKNRTLQVLKLSFLFNTKQLKQLYFACRNNYTLTTIEYLSHPKHKVRLLNCSIFMELGLTEKYGKAKVFSRNIVPSLANNYSIPTELQSIIFKFHGTIETKNLENEEYTETRQIITQDALLPLYLNNNYSEFKEEISFNKTNKCSSNSCNIM